MQTYRYVIFLLVFCTNIYASESKWVSIAEISNVAAEFDESSVVVKNELTEGTFRFTYSAPQKSQNSRSSYQSVEVKALFSCQSKTFVPYHRREFSGQQGKGELVREATLSESQWKLTPIVSGSMNEIMYARVCINNAVTAE
ncbi:surface-adhesin E family protein [Undibacterium sp. Ji67W]|uniref:surface-adhesin E family protein n=1 Tax=Undibacterium sp. Ji67W TaxID=3413042 RepID=UPI003BF2EACD